MTVFDHRVRYHEADAQGYLFNARYLEIADVGLVEFFREHGWSYQRLVSGGTDPSVVSAELTFRRPARFDDSLRVSVECTAVGRSSFRLRTDVMIAGPTGTLDCDSVDADPIASMELVYVNVDTGAGASRPLPEAVSRLLRDALSQ